MDVRISPSVLRGEVSAIASKSDAHRCIICAALAHTPTTLTIDTKSDDIKATLHCIEELGAKVDYLDRNRLIITPIRSSPLREPTLDCGESGSTLRFLLPVACALYPRVSFTGSGRLPERPLSPLMEEMEAHGCCFSSRRLPFTVEGRLRGGRYTLPGNISSQYITGLLLALPLIDSGGEIILTSAPESSGYIDMTMDTLTRFGIRVDQMESGYAVLAKQTYHSPGEVKIDGDWSNAAFWITAGVLSGGITCVGLDPHSRQGDRHIVDILRKMGADIQWNGTKVVAKPSALHAIEIDAAEIPDLIPILSVAAATANGTTRIKNAGRLRAKESDRLSAISDCLNRLGAVVSETESGLEIAGRKPLAGGTVDGYNDHRIVMSMAVASAVSTSDVLITNAEAVNKSYPHFFKDYQMLGGTIDVINDR